MTFEKEAALFDKGLWGLCTSQGTLLIDRNRSKDEGTRCEVLLGLFRPLEADVRSGAYSHQTQQSIEVGHRKIESIPELRRASRKSSGRSIRHYGWLVSKVWCGTIFVPPSERGWVKLAMMLSLLRR
jgi:hypothetical protein